MNEKNIVKILIDNTKVSFDKEIFDFFMNKYLEQDISTYSSQEGACLFDLLRNSNDDSSSMNMDDYKKLINKLITLAVDEYKKSNKPVNTQEVITKIVSGLNSKQDKLTFDSSLLFDKKREGQDNIIINLYLNSKDVISVVDLLINSFVEKGLPFNIIVPSATQMQNNYPSELSIYVSDENIKGSVSILDSLDESIKSLAIKNKYLASNNWYSINTISNDISADVVIGKSIISGLTKTLSEESKKNSYYIDNGLNFDNALNSTSRKDLIRKQAYDVLITSDPLLKDKIYNKVIEEIRNNNINPNNVYMFNSVFDSLDKKYGIKDLEENSMEIVNKEVLPSHPVEPATQSDMIVDETMKSIGNEVNEIINESSELNTNEKESIMNTIDVSNSNLELENKYMGLLDGVEGWTFDSKVKDIDGKDISLLEFLEKNNTLNKVPFDSVVTLLDNTTEDGVSVSGKRFISKYVLDSLRLNATNPVSPGGLSLEEIMEKYVDKIESPELGIIYPEGLTTPMKNNKSTFLKKIFKGR